MRVLVVTIVHHPEDARIRHRQLQALLAAGHRVVYAAPYSAYGSAIPADVDVIDLPRAAGRHRLRAIRAARREIRARRDETDLVLLHDPELLLSVRGLRGLPPVVWDVHEDTAAAVSLKPWLPAPVRWLARAAVRRAERYAERRYHLLLADGSYLSRFRRSHPVVPNVTWIPDTVRTPGPCRVVYVGHLARARGAFEMVELGRLLGDEVRVELIGAADEETQTAIETAAAAGYVKWHGFMPNDQALDLVEGALAGLSLLHDEANYRYSRPTKVIEYMACGIPVIATATEASKELLGLHKAGIVVPFDDVPAVVDAIKRLRDDAALRAEMGRNGHRAARERYAWPAYASEFVAQLEIWARQGGRQRAPIPHQRRARRVRMRRPLDP
jgi:glycosyltransferase involved in cell wall biosynthesis